MYDDDAILLEYDRANTLLATYSHGEEVDQPLAMARGAESFFYHTDHLGSVRLVTDGAGSVANAYDYDAFGNLEPTSFETVANPFGFTARERDAESGLMFYRARTYDPKIGRFISHDPIGCDSNDLNLYRYVFNGPTISSDPSGKITLVEYAFVTTSVLGVGAAGIATGALPDPTPVLEDALAAVGTALRDLFAIIAAYVGHVGKSDAECDEEWREAREDCAKELAKPHPNQGITGGYDNIDDCAKGLVSEECGGNQV